MFSLIVVPVLILARGKNERLTNTLEMTEIS